MFPKLSQYDSPAKWAVAFLLALTEAFEGIANKLQGQGPAEHSHQLDTLTAALEEIGSNPEAMASLTIEQTEALERLVEIRENLEQVTAAVTSREQERQNRVLSLQQRLAASAKTPSVAAAGVDDEGGIVSVGRAVANPALIAAGPDGVPPTAAQLQTALENMGIQGRQMNGLGAEAFVSAPPAAASADAAVAKLATELAPKYYARTDVRQLQITTGNEVPQSQIVTLMEQAATMPITSSDGKLYVASASRAHVYPQDLMVHGGDKANLELQAANDAVVQRLMEWRKNSRREVLARQSAREGYEGFLKAVVEYMSGDVDRVAASAGLSGLDDDGRYAAAAALCGPGNQEFIWRACTSSNTPIHDGLFTDIPVAPGNQSLPLSRYRTMSLRDVAAALNYGINDGGGNPTGPVPGNKDCPDGTASAKSCIPLPAYCGDRITSTMCAYWLCIEWGLFTEFTAPGMIAAQLQLLEMLEARWYEQQALDYIWKNSTHVPVTNFWTGGASVAAAFIREMETRFNSMRLAHGQTVDIATDAWLPIALWLSSTMTPDYALPAEYRWDSPGAVVSWLQGLPGVSSVTFSVDPFDTTVSSGAPSNGWTVPAAVNTNQGNRAFPSASYLSVVPSGGFGRVTAFNVDLGFSNGQGVFDIHTAMGNKKSAFKERAYGFYNLPPVDCFTPFTLTFSSIGDWAKGTHPLATALSLSALTS